MKRSMLAALVAVLALGLIGAPIGADEHSATYEAPYSDGPAGGASFNHIQRDSDGRVIIGRINPVPGPISCDPGGAFALFEVEHTLTGPVESIRAEFTEGVLDPYVFVTIAAREADREWLGKEVQRGPTILDGDIELLLDPDLFDEQDGLWIDDVITIQFGLEMASACPHATFGTARFTQITVS